VKKLVAVTVVSVLLLSLLIWTLLAPPILSPQSPSGVSNSLFQFSKTTKELNVTDGEGSYSFLVGMEYNETVSPGSPTIVEVFVSLVHEAKSSSFLRGVYLKIDSAGVLIDGKGESGSKQMITSNDGLITDRISGIDINQTSGEHSLVARLIFSTVDVNYIGYASGNQQVLQLNGTISIV